MQDPGDYDPRPASRLFEAFVPPLVRARLTGEQPGPPAPSVERLSSIVLFADLTGFSTLAERLAPSGTRGAEDLRDLLNRFFGSVVRLVDSFGGQVLNFPGDAVVALWVIEPGAGDDAARHAVACALSMHTALDAAPSGRSSTLRLHAGIGTGELWAAHVGTADRWHLVAAGEALRQATAAAAAAGPGSVVVSNEVWRLIHHGSEGVPLPWVGVRVRLVAPAATRPRRVEMPAAAPERLRAYIPRSVLAKVDAGQTEWLGEFRRVTVLFVNIGPIDTAADAALDRLQRAAVIVKHAVDRYGGSINQMIADDKGTVIACGWGLAMHAHGDDAVRAAHAALWIDRELRAVGLGGSFGLATGEIFTGLRGDATRCDYAMIGSAVNLAARLMELADQEILCDEASFEAASSRLRFEMVGARPVRGFGRDVQQYRLVEGPAAADSADLVGRRTEQAILSGQLDEVLAGGRGSVIVVEGDAGIGKSRLLADLVDRAGRRAVRTVVASGDAIERSQPYHVWQQVFENLLGLRGERGADESRVARLVSDARFQPFLSVLNSVLGLGFEETERAKEIAPRGRALMTRDLLLHLFEGCIGPHPALVVLDDTHWFDSASWALVESIQRAMPAVLLVIATRPISHENRSPELQRICALDSTRMLRLDPLSAAATRELVCQRLGARVLDPEVDRLIVDKAEGHPFFAEQLATALGDRHLVRVDRGVCHFTGASAAGESLALPNTVQVMVSSRIDELTMDEQLTLKVASVLGESFTVPVLEAIHPLETRGHDLIGHCEALVEHHLLRVESRTPPVYAFKHALIQEVAYNLLPYSQRRTLHAQVGRWLEGADSAGPDVPAALLAHHWSRAEVPERALVYLERAAHQAMSRYANLEAVRFFSEALATDARSGRTALADADVTLPRRRVPGRDARRVRWQRRLGDAHANLGAWNEARRSFENALALIGQDLPTSSWGWAFGIGRELATQCGHRLLPRLTRTHPPDAAALVREAVCAYERMGALSYYTERLPPMFYSLLAALNLAEQLGPNPEVAIVYADVGNIAGIVPSHRLARLYNRMARETASALGSPAVSARVLGRSSLYRIAVGDWAACADLERSLELCEHVADPYQWEESAAIRARAAHFRGEYALAERLGREIRRRASASGSSAHEIWGIDAELWGLWFRGEHQRAAEMALEGLELIASAARPDRVPTLDLLGAVALARLASGDVDGALEATGRIEAVLAAAPRPGHFATLGMSAAAETWIAVWELGPASGQAAIAETKAHQACQVLERYARVNPPARARAALWRGCVEWLRGRRRSAHQSWQRSLEEAERFGLPYERGRAHCEIARHLRAGDAARSSHLAAAEREFLAIDARFELSRLEATVRAGNVAPAGLW